MLHAQNDSFIYKLLDDPLYQVREDGSIWTLRSRQGHISNVWRLVRVKTRSGYRFITYGNRTDGRRQLAIHRIIYAKFNGPLQKTLVINHLDGIPANNAPSNLELVTQSQNNFHRFRNKKPLKDVS